MKKKVIIAFAAILAVLLAFSGCSSSDIGDTTTTPDSISSCCSSDDISALDENTTKNSGGILSSFTSQDISGSGVSEKIFSGYKLTMVNIWATYCSPCINEMPDLAEINEEYASKGFQVVGIPVDVTDSDGNVNKSLITEAQSIISETGADYTHILPSTSLSKAVLSSVYSVPTTIFVDENGKQVGNMYIGSKSKSAWEKVIDKLLTQV